MCEQSLLFFKIEHSLNTTHQCGTVHISIENGKLQGCAHIRSAGIVPNGRRPGLGQNWCIVVQTDGDPFAWGHHFSSPPCWSYQAIFSLCFDEATLKKVTKALFSFNPRQRLNSNTVSPKDIDCLTEWQICFHSDEIRQIYLIGRMISNIWGNNGRACIWWFLMLSPDWMRQSR